MAEASRLRFALDNLGPTDWEAFQEFASAFLTVDFPDIRSIGGTGDRGRDAVLFGAEPDVVIQYSIKSDWADKIRGTVATVKEAGIKCSLLVYATNRSVGPRADDLKRELLRVGINLDMRDQRYFLDRIDRSASTRASAGRLSSRIVDPLLPTTDLVRNSDLTQPEMRAGLLYLELQLRDADLKLGLTKLCVESLILAALAGTDPEHMRSRAEIEAQVRRQFPGQDPGRMSDLIGGALLRLRDKRSTVVKGSTDSYALHHQERLRLAEKAERMVEERQAVHDELALRVEEMRGLLELQGHASESEDFLDVLESVFEAILEQQGNDFVAALSGSEKIPPQIDIFDVTKNMIVARWPNLKSIGLEPGDLAEIANETIRRTLIGPGENTRVYLRNLADAYTLLAFLRQTPDVTRAVDRLFSKGRLILDATVLLPLFAETLRPSAEQRFTNLLKVAAQAGLKLQVVDGVLEEIEAHFRRSLTCYRMSEGKWEGDIPFVLRHWREVHPGAGDFAAFLSEFRGTHPVDDLADFLHSAASVERVDVATAADTFDLSVRGQITELWRARKHAKRPLQPDDELDLLLRHDVEMYFGVLGLRKEEHRRLFGYETWWVTSDASAFAIYGLSKRDGLQLPSNPCMHPNFLSNILAIGPARRTLEPSFRLLLPVALNIHYYGWGVPALAEAARGIREKYAGKPEWFMRRHIRDALDQLRGTPEWHEREVAGEDTLAVTG